MTTPITTEALERGPSDLAGAKAATSLDSAAAIALVDSIDLSMVKLKLMDEEEGEGWSRQYADYAEKRYRRYLVMLLLRPDISSVPTGEIDSFWHQHILDTRAYADDCQRVFGEFVHHFPYFGMRGDEDARNLISSFETTKVLYSGLFGEEYVSDRNETSSKCHKACTTSSCKTCARGCSGVPCKTCKKG